MGTVSCASSQAQLEGWTSSYCSDWDPETLPPPGGMRGAGASPAPSVLAQEVEAARNDEPRRETQHTPSSKLTVW